MGQTAESREGIGEIKKNENQDSDFIKLLSERATIGPTKIPPSPISFIPTYIEASVAKGCMPSESPTIFGSISCRMTDTAA